MARLLESVWGITLPKVIALALVVGSGHTPRPLIVSEAYARLALRLAVLPKSHRPDAKSNP